MARYINADELQAKINGISDYLDALSQLELVCDAIANAPTADVREVMSSAWIPVSERLPENCGYYLVTDRIPNADMVGESYFDAFSQQWHDAWDVITWMPKPEPYRGDA